MDSKTEVAVLETRLENFENLVSRLDSAIEKIAEVNNNVSRMLAVHEERISKQEEIDSVLFDKIDKLRDKMDSDHDIVTQRLSLLERKLWIGIGVLGAIVAFSNPQAIKTLKPLLSSAESAIVAPAVAFVNGSYWFQVYWTRITKTSEVQEGKVKPLQLPLSYLWRLTEEQE